VRTAVEGRVCAEAEGERCAFGLKLGKRLIEEIRPLVDRHGVGESYCREFLGEALTFWQAYAKLRQRPL